ncbi:hypothetical protein [Dysgonomonas sp.]
MVKKILFILGSLLILSSSFLKGQTMDSVKCEDYFRRINNDLLITRWSQAPILKESNDSIICKLCEILLNNSFENTTSTLIIDQRGNPICTETNIEFDIDSLRNNVVTLLYSLKFEPAIRDKKPVISHFHLIINDKKCNKKNYK